MPGLYDSRARCIDCYLPIEDDDVVLCADCKKPLHSFCASSGLCQMCYSKGD